MNNLERTTAPFSVAHLLWDLDIGGVSKLVFDLAQALSETLSITPSVAVGTSEGTLTSEFKRHSISVFHAGFRSGFDFSPNRISHLTRHLANFSIIHCHSFFLPGATALIKANRPIVYTEHGNFRSGKRVSLKDATKAYLFSGFCRHYVSAVTFNSEYTYSLWQHNLPHNRVSRIIIPNGVRLVTPNRSAATDSEPIARTNSSKAGTIGVVARLASVKRIDRLISVLPQLVAVRDVQLVIVGDGPERLPLESLATKLGIRQNVTFVGAVSNPVPYYRGMDVTVLPSQSESFGLAAVEALALGKPVVVFKDGGAIADIVGQISPEDVVSDNQQLLERLLFYTSNDQASLLLSDERQRYVQRFDIRSTAAAFVELYSTVLKQ